MEYSKEEEFKLVDDILDGSRDKYRVLVDRYAPVVFSIVRRFAGSEDEADELSQQIFVKAYERLESFKKDSKFSSWLYTLARNHCIDYSKNIRRKNRQLGELNQGEQDSLMQDHASPDQEMLQTEWRVLLEEALRQITADNAEAFLYKYRDEMTYQAMSKRLGVSISALKVRVHRARKELKEYIENQT